MSHIQTTSFWHYPRQSLTGKLVQSFTVGLINSFILFAPRRLGKTEFLLHDLKPALEQNGFKTIYFSFYDASTSKIQSLINIIKSEIKQDFFTTVKLKEVNLPWCKFSFTDGQINTNDMNISEILAALSYQVINSGQSGLVLLLDEIQELQMVPDSEHFVSGLRTALDINKETIRVIFTGSSQNGLKKMFANSKAPFFHFGTNIDLPKFEKDFTDYLVDRFFERIQVPIDKDELYNIFIKVDRITAHIRQIINMLLLEPNITLLDAYNDYMKQMYNPEIIENDWNQISDTEKAIYLWTLQNKSNFYGEPFKEFLIEKFPNEKGTNSKIQYALNKLLDKNEIRSLNTGEFECSNIMLNKWLLELSEFNQLLK